MKLRRLLALCLLAPSGITAAGELSDAAVGQILGAPNLSHTSKTRFRPDGNVVSYTYLDEAGRPVVTLVLDTPDQYDAQKAALLGTYRSELGLGLEACRFKELPTLSGKLATSYVYVVPLRQTITNEQTRALVKAAL